MTFVQLVAAYFLRVVSAVFTRVHFCVCYCPYFDVGVVSIWYFVVVLSMFWLGCLHRQCFYM